MSIKKADYFFFFFNFNFFAMVFIPQLPFFYSN